MGENRRPVDVEKLLHWAFRDELPKRSLDGTWGFEASPMFNLVTLGTHVDSSSIDPGFPTIMGGPHPDALAVGDAVATLEDLAVDWPGSRPHLIADFAGLVGDHDPTLASLTINRGGLVGMHAKMGTRPRGFERPTFGPVIGANGKPKVQFLDDRDQLVDGRKARHYGRGARCPLLWWPAPRSVAFARVEYVVWHDALVELAGALQLGERIALPPAAPEKPWLLDDRMTETLNHRARDLAFAD